MKKLIFISLFIFQGITGLTQKAARPPRVLGYSGIGAGLDYGGLGVKGEVIMTDWLGLFIGGGYNYKGFGWNAGVNLKFAPEAKSTGILTAMYGYNTVLVIQNSSGEYVNVYYGISAGGGLEFFVGKNKNKFALAILVPFRGLKYKSDHQYFVDRRYTISDPFPVLLSIGFHFSHLENRRRP